MASQCSNQAATQQAECPLPMDSGETQPDVDIERFINEFENLALEGHEETEENTGEINGYVSNGSSSMNCNVPIHGGKGNHYEHSIRSDTSISHDSVSPAKQSMSSVSAVTTFKLVLSEKSRPQNNHTRVDAIVQPRINNQIYNDDIQNCEICKEYIKASADAQLLSKMHEMYHKIPQSIRSSQAQKSETKFQLENSSSVKSGRQQTTAGNIIASVDKRQPEWTTVHTHPQTNLSRIHYTSKIPIRSRSSAGNLLSPISLQSATSQSNTMVYAKRQANVLLSCKTANHQRNYQESRERNVEDNATLPDMRNVSYAMHEQLKQFESKPSTNDLHSTEHADNSQQETNLRNNATTSQLPLYPTVELANLKKEELGNNYGQLVLGETSSDNSLPKEMIHGKEKKSETQESCNTSGIKILGTTESLRGRGDEDDSMMVDILQNLQNPRRDKDENLHSDTDHQTNIQSKPNSITSKAQYSNSPGMGLNEVTQMFDTHNNMHKEEAFSVSGDRQVNATGPTKKQHKVNATMVLKSDIIQISESILLDENKQNTNCSTVQDKKVLISESQRGTRNMDTPKTHCFLCGKTNNVDKHCDRCSNSDFCDECYKIYHQHPRRKNHEETPRAVGQSTLGCSPPTLTSQKLNSSATWECQSCTFQNKKAANFCEVCGNRNDEQGTAVEVGRYSDTGRKQMELDRESLPLECNISREADANRRLHKESAIKNDEDSHVGQWQCKHCTSWNIIEIHRCEICYKTNEYLYQLFKMEKQNSKTNMIAAVEHRRTPQERLSPLEQAGISKNTASSTNSVDKTEDRDNGDNNLDEKWKCHFCTSWNSNARHICGACYKTNEALYQEYRTIVKSAENEDDEDDEDDVYRNIHLGTRNKNQQSIEHGRMDKETRRSNLEKASSISSDSQVSLVDNKSHHYQQHDHSHFYSGNNHNDGRQVTSNPKSEISSQVELNDKEKMWYRRLLAEGKVESKTKAKIAAKLICLGYDEKMAVHVSGRCRTIDDALKDLNSTVKGYMYKFEVWMKNDPK